MSLGKDRTACETLSRTSFAASSSSLSRLNSILMLLVPWLLEEEIFFIPSILFTAFSSGSVIWDSIISELAPG